MRTFTLTIVAAGLLFATLPGQARAACKCNNELFKCLVATSFDKSDTIPNIVKCFKEHKECLGGCPFHQCKKECRTAARGSKAMCKQKAAKAKTKCGGAQAASCKKTVKAAKKRCLKEAKEQKKTCKQSCKEQK